MFSSAHLPWCPLTLEIQISCQCERDRYLVSAALAGAGSIVGYIFAKIIGSIAGEGDSIHLFFDGGQSLISAIIAVIALRPTSNESSVRRIGAYSQAFLLAMAAVLIWVDASHHNDVPRSGVQMIVLGIASSAVAIIRFIVVHSEWKTITGKGEVLHVGIDVATSFCVLLAGIAVLLGAPAWDKIAAMWFIAPIALLNSGYILWHARFGEIHSHHGHDHHHH